MTDWHMYLSIYAFTGLLVTGYLLLATINALKGGRYSVATIILAGVVWVYLWLLIIFVAGVNLLLKTYRRSQ